MNKTENIHWLFEFKELFCLWINIKIFIGIYCRGEGWKWKVEGIHYLKHTTNKPSSGGYFKNWILEMLRLCSSCLDFITLVSGDYKGLCYSTLQDNLKSDLQQQALPELYPVHMLNSVIFAHRMLDNGHWRWSSKKPVLITGRIKSNRADHPVFWRA